MMPVVPWPLAVYRLMSHMFCKFLIKHTERDTFKSRFLEATSAPAGLWHCPVSWKSVVCINTSSCGKKSDPVAGSRQWGVHSAAQPLPGGWGSGSFRRQRCVHVYCGTGRGGTVLEPSHCNYRAFGTANFHKIITTYPRKRPSLKVGCHCLSKTPRLSSQSDAWSCHWNSFWF